MGQKIMDTSFLNKLHTALKRCKCSVFVYAFIDLNVGDDLFIHKLVSSYPDVHFVMIARKPYKEMFAKYPNVTVYETDGFLLKLCQKLRIDKKIRWRIAHECDYAVYVGGSVMIEYSDWKDQHIWYKELFDNDRLYILGCNWGPCKTKRFEENMREVFSEIKDICFRDQYSYQTFSDLQNVRYAPDIMFGMDWSPYAGVEEKKQVLVSVVNCRSRSVGLGEYTQDYSKFIGDLTTRFVELGYHVVFCSFWERNGDLTAAREIRESLPPQVQKSTSIANYCGTNLDQILELIVESEYVVATRFHAMILGLAAKKKVLPVIYNQKLRTVLEDLSFQGACCDIRQLPEDCSKTIEEIAYGIDDKERERLARQSADHFKLLNEILK